MKRPFLVATAAIAVLGACATAKARKAEGPRCPGEKVAVCHAPPGNPSNRRTLCLPGPAVEAHLVHGDLPGECAGPVPGKSCREGKVRICHVPPGDPAKAKEKCVGAEALEAHLGHGDAEGPCGSIEAPDPTPAEPVEAGNRAE